MLELIRIGFFESFFFVRGPLALVDWGFTAVGFLIQYHVLKKSRRAVFRWLFPGLLLAGIAVGEYQMYAVTGWDRLGVIVLYWPVVCLSLGALAGWLAARYRGQKTALQGADTEREREE